VQDEAGFGKHDTFEERCAGKNEGGDAASGRVLGEADGGDVFLELAEAVGQLVFVAEVGEALEFTQRGGRDENLLAGGETRAHFRHEGRNIPVIARCGLGEQYAGLAVGAAQRELLEEKAGERSEGAAPFVGREKERVPGEGGGGFFGAGEEALDGVVEGLGLVEDHQRAIGEIEECAGARLEARGFELPARRGAGKRKLAFGGVGGGLNVETLKEVATTGELGERREDEPDARADGALRGGVELAEGFDGVAEELEADGARVFGGENVHNAAADGELAGHFDSFMAGIADSGEVFEQVVERHLGVAFESAGEAGVGSGVPETHEGGGDGDNH